MGKHNLARIKTDARKREEQRMITRPTKTPYVKEGDDEKGKQKKTPKVKIISKVIRKPTTSPTKKAPPPSDEEEDGDDDIFLDDLVAEEELEAPSDEINFDELPADNGDDD